MDRRNRNEARQVTKEEIEGDTIGEGVTMNDEGIQHERVVVNDRRYTETN